MLLEKTPYKLIPTGQASFDALHGRGEYRTLEEAIRAAADAKLDSTTAVIEKNGGGRHTVNDWIMVRIAGGVYRE